MENTKSDNSRIRSVEISNWAKEWNEVCSKIDCVYKGGATVIDYKSDDNREKMRLLINSFDKLTSDSQNN